MTTSEILTTLIFRLRLSEAANSVERHLEAARDIKRQGISFSLAYSACDCLLCSPEGPEEVTAKVRGARC